MRRFINNSFKDLKEFELSEAATIGLVLGFTFWIALDSFLLGITFGAIFFIAYNEETKKKLKK